MILRAIYQNMPKLHTAFLFSFFAIILFLLSVSCNIKKTRVENALMSGETNYFEYNNSKIWYLDKGSGNTFIFVHGFASSSYTWRYLEKYYSKQNRVICLDLKGFGQSSKPHDESYSIKDQSEILLKFIQTKNLHNVTMVGHSFGGAVVLLSYISAQ